MTAPDARGPLYEWTPHGAQRTAEDNPRTRPCPTCLAEVAQPCVSRTRGRSVMTGYHDARQAPPAQTTEEPFMTTQIEDRECACGHFFGNHDELGEPDAGLAAGMGGVVIVSSPCRITGCDCRDYIPAVPPGEPVRPSSAAVTASEPGPADTEESGTGSEAHRGTDEQTGEAFWKYLSPACDVDGDR